MARPSEEREPEPYRESWARAAKKFYLGLDGGTRALVDQKVDQLCVDPLLGKSLGGRLQGLRSVRFRKLRLIYSFDPNDRVLKIKV